MLVVAQGGVSELQQDVESIHVGGWGLNWNSETQAMKGGIWEADYTVSQLKCGKESIYRGTGAMTTHINEHN